MGFHVGLIQMWASNSIFAIEICKWKKLDSNLVLSYFISAYYLVIKKIIHM